MNRPDTAVQKREPDEEGISGLPINKSEDVPTRAFGRSTLGVKPDEEKMVATSSPIGPLHTVRYSTYGRSSSLALCKPASARIYMIGTIMLPPLPLFIYHLWSGLQGVGS